MKKHSSDKDALRQSIMGFGENSMRKSYYSNLKQSEEEVARYRALFQESSEAICVLQGDTLQFIDVNTGAVQLFGKSEEQLKETTFVNLLSEKEQAILVKWINARTASRFQHKTTIDVNENEILFSYSLKRVSFNGTEYMTLLAQDITQVTQMEEQLHQADKLGAIGQLAGGIAHDFNNQLSGIMGFAELIKIDAPSGSELQDNIEGILACAQQASQLTSKLLAFARKKGTQKQCVDTHRIIGEVVILLQHSIDKRIRLKTNFEAIIATINGDGSQIQNALLNLGVNARDAMTGNGDIIYSTRVMTLTESFMKDHNQELKPGEYLCISITDTGSGIPKALQKKIFDPFFTTKAEGKGTGLGLSAVYGTIRDHGGFLTLYSEEGLGTTFNIYLPLLRNSKAEQRSEKITAPQGTGTILLVDDEAAIRESAKKHLTRHGYSVLTACDGVEGIAIFRENYRDIDMIILDMIMPHMNGLDFLKKIREIGDTTPVLVASGYSHNGEIDEAMNLENVSFIQKPFPYEELLLKVSEILTANS